MVVLLSCSRSYSHNDNLLILHALINAIPVFRFDFMMTEFIVYILGDLSAILVPFTKQKLLRDSRCHAVD